MRATFQNSGTAVSIGVVFTLMIAGLSSSAAVDAERRADPGSGVPAGVAHQVATLPPVSSLFASVLGVNPIEHLLAPTGVLAKLPAASQADADRAGVLPQPAAGPVPQRPDRRVRRVGRPVGAGRPGVAAARQAPGPGQPRGRRVAAGIPGAARLIPLTTVNKTRRAAALATGVICAVQFVLQLDFSIVNVALNTIQRELSMPPAELQWIVTGYALTFGSLLLAGGRLADLLGRRRLLVIGLVLFAVASLGCGLARWPVMLIVARMVQGAAAALASPAALSLLTTASPEGHERNRALALWQASTAGGATTGIIAGGLLTQYLGWRAVFLVNPPLIALLLAFVPRLPAGTAAGGGKVGIRGAALVTAAIAALIYGLTEGQQHGFGSPASVAALVAAVVLAVAFIYSERTLPAPMLPPSLLAAPARRAAIAAMLLIGATLAGYVYFLSLYLQKVHHFSPVQTGLGLLPSTLTVVLMSTLVTRRLLTRFGARPVLLAGLVIMTAGQLWLAFMITRQLQLPGRRAARPAAHLAVHRPVAARRVGGDHHRRARQGPGHRRRHVHHRPAGRRGRGPGRARDRRRRAHRRRGRRRGGRLPAVVPHRRRPGRLRRRPRGAGPLPRALPRAGGSAPAAASPEQPGAINPLVRDRYGRFRHPSIEDLR